MKRKPKRYRLLPLLSLTLLTLLVSLNGCNARRDYQAALLLEDIAAGKAPSRLKSATTEPVRRAVTFTVPGRTLGGDLYLAGTKPMAGVLLLPGAAENGKDDPRLQAFAGSLARAGFAVMVPDLAGLRTLRVTSSDIADTVEAFSWLAGREDLAPEGRAGFLSFSYACGPAILAALHPAIAPRVRFVMSVGGYFSLPELLTFFTTGYYLRDGEWRFMQPNGYGKWIFVASNIGRLRATTDQELFRQLARRKLADLEAPVGDLVRRLTPEGRSVYDFVDNRDPARALPLMERLPAAIRREIDALDLAKHDLSRLRARFILVHGYDDDIIPYTQSVALERHLPPGTTRLYLVRGLQHVELEPRVIDKYRLWRALSALLRSAS
ncbi:MAG TPA: alpha/beta hydrolase [Geobacter sp.]|nr:alpha/beta hydrolase [Geobacter sp.]